MATPTSSRAEAITHPVAAYTSPLRRLGASRIPAPRIRRVSQGRIVASLSNRLNACCTWATSSDWKTSNVTGLDPRSAKKGTPSPDSLEETSLAVPVRSISTTPFLPLELVRTDTTCFWAARLAVTHNSANRSLVTARLIRSLANDLTPVVMGAASTVARSGRTCLTSASMSTLANSACSRRADTAFWIAGSLASGVTVST